MMSKNICLQYLFQSKLMFYLSIDRCMLIIVENIALPL